MDIERLRKDTPGTNSIVHFNNAGSSLMPNPVFESMIKYLGDEHIKGGYETADLYHIELEETYAEISDLIGSKTNEIAYKENATSAWQCAFASINFNPGDIILSNTVEYASNYIPFIQWKNKYGIKVEVIEEGENGEISLSNLEEKLTDKVKLVSLTHMPTSGGLTQPAEKVGEIVSESNAYYLLDACQSIV